MSTFGFGTVICPFLFHDVGITTAAGLVGVCVVMGLVSVGYEGIAPFRRVLFKRRDAEWSGALNGENMRLRDAGAEKRRPFKKWIGHITLQCMMYMLQAFVNYILMLSVMTGNAWLAIAIVMGAALGYFLLTPLSSYMEEQPPSGPKNPCTVTRYSSTENEPHQMTVKPSVGN